MGLCVQGVAVLTEQTTGLALLRAPFPEHQISLLPKPTKRDAPKGKCTECGGWHGLPAVHLSYVGHAALTDRLLDADPAWTWEPLAMADGLPVLDGFGGMWIKLTVCGVTRLGYGHAGDKQGGDAIKEVIGDALRNAAMRFGAALDLWHKGQLHVDDDDEPRKTDKRTAPDHTGRAMPANKDAPSEFKATAATVMTGVLVAGGPTMVASDMANWPQEKLDGVWGLLNKATQDKLTAAWPKAEA